MNRVTNTLKNSSAGIVAYIVTSLLNFALRKIFVTQLGTSCLGINGLFLSVISALSVAELGFGTAILFCLYEPVAKNDKNAISSIMSYYKRIYQKVAFLVFIMGLAVIPFFPYMLNGYESEYNPYIIYVIFLATTVSSYFFSYKKSIFIANQKQHIVTNITCIFTIVKYASQAIVLLFLKNYYLYLFIALFEAVGTNAYISFKAQKNYPKVFEDKDHRLDGETKKLIKKNVKSLMLHRIGGVVVNSTDNILLSSLTTAGITTVGLYSNYLMVTSILVNMCGQLFSGMVASYGNLNVLGDIKKKLDVYWKTNFMTFWIYGFCSICLLVLINPFITLVFGVKYVLGDMVVYIVVLNFFLSGIRKPNLMISEALGLYWFDRYKPIAEAVINLATSILLAKYLDIVGVFIGTTISTLLTGFWVEPWNIFKNGFVEKWKHNFAKYFLRYAIYTNIIVGTYLITAFVASLNTSFIYECFVCLVVPNVIFTIVYCHTREFRSLVEIARNLLLSSKNKKRRIN